MLKRKTRVFSGTMSPEVTERETESRKIARRAAAEGIVLLKNEGLLPVSEGKAVIYGNGAAHAMKGGTGSGDVNEREVVSILSGLLADGLCVLNADVVAKAEKLYDEERLSWRDKIIGMINSAGGGSGMQFFDVYAENPFTPSAVVPVVKEEAEQADLAIYVISRVAGEGADRYDKEGDYYLTATEISELKELAKYTDKIAVLINAGGQVDLQEVEKIPQIKAILNVSQGGMEQGNAIADVLTGRVNPSGKLTDTWAVRYEDYPCAATFSHNNGNVENEKYEEGIYVGYRYFDSFGVKTAYPFGFGLSYTTFEITAGAVTSDGASIRVSAAVTNTGKTYAGREVVQVYAACPQTGLKKEFKRLIGFAKTKLLAPGESQTITITSPIKTIASYDTAGAAWIAQAGDYAVFVGNSSKDIALAGVLTNAETVVLQKVHDICPLQTELTEIERPDDVIEELTAAWKAQAKGISAVSFVPQPVAEKEVPVNPAAAEAAAIAKKLTDEELTVMLLGEITKGQDSVQDNVPVATGIYVPGSAGETSMALEEKYDVPAVPMADGPAGLRLLRSYQVNKETNLIYGKSLMSALEGGLFSGYKNVEGADTYYQYATAIPIGTLLAQSFDPELIEGVGAMVGKEMQEFGVAWWLAPGLNIHRDPLCGRNFEYYSEDPLVSGIIAAAMTRGVQSVPGVGTTIKHYACNNQEDNRMGSNSIVSQRALRELYLRGFEIAIETAQPMCIMTSYNLINGVHTANSYDLCTVVARDECKFRGVIMTDWTTTTNGSVPHGCALAQNDLIMPGFQSDIDDILAALADGSLPREQAEKCVANIITVALQTLGMEDPAPYGAQFDTTPYVTAE